MIDVLVGGMAARRASPGSVGCAGGENNREANTSARTDTSERRGISTKMRCRGNKRADASKRERGNEISMRKKNRPHRFTAFARPEPARPPLRLRPLLDASHFGLRQMMQTRNDNLRKDVKHENAGINPFSC
jgi:hypothetical protein